MLSRERASRTDRMSLASQYSIVTFEETGAPFRVGEVIAATVLCAQADDSAVRRGMALALLQIGSPT